MSAERQVLAPAPSPDDPFGENRSASWYLHKELVPHEGLMIDPNRAITEKAKNLNEALGTSALIVGLIHAGEAGFALVDSRDIKRAGAPFLLFNGANINQVKAIHPDTEVTIGREHHADKFTYPKSVSGKHFSLSYNSESDTLHIRDEKSTNGTRVSAHIFTPEGMMRERDNIQANFTSYLADKVSSEGAYWPATPEAPYGFLNGHPIIGRNSRSVRNGIYGTAHSEQLVVDDASRYVSGIVGRFMHETHRFARETSNNQRDILRRIERFVADIMNYDADAVERLSKPHFESRGMIMMSDYMKAGVGVCRHQAVLAALIMEQAIDEGVLEGSIGVQRNMDTEVNGAHAWAVFRDTSNHAIIVDPAQRFVGTREEAKAESGRRWNYYVPVED